LRSPSRSTPQISNPHPGWSLSRRRALFDLALESAGGTEIEMDRYVGICGVIETREVLERVLKADCRGNGEIDFPGSVSG
jgi:hypothetical protein